MLLRRVATALLQQHLPAFRQEWHLARLQDMVFTLLLASLLAQGRLCHLVNLQGLKLATSLQGCQARQQAFLVDDLQLAMRVQ